MIGPVFVDTNVIVRQSELFAGGALPTSPSATTRSGRSRGDRMSTIRLVPPAMGTILESMSTARASGAPARSPGISSSNGAYVVRPRRSCPSRSVWRRFQLRLALPAPTPALAQEWFRRFEQRLGAKLVPAPSTLARRLGNLSFAELEQFCLDIQRHHVLNLPESDVRAIVGERLQQWRKRVPPAGSRAMAQADGGDA